MTVNSNLIVENVIQIKSAMTINVDVNVKIFWNPRTWTSEIDYACIKSIAVDLATAFDKIIGVVAKLYNSVLDAMLIN